MKIKLKTILRLLLMIFLILFVCYQAFKDDYKIILNQIMHISIWGYLPVLFLGMSQCLIQGWILYRLSKPYHKEFQVYDGIQNAFICAFFNSVTPLGGGQASQTYVLRRHRFTYSEIAAILWKDFFLYQCSLLLCVGFILSASMRYARQTFPTAIIWVLLGYIINISVILFLWTMSRYPNLYVRISAFTAAALNKIHLIKEPQKLYQKGKALIDDFSIHIHLLKKDKRQIGMILLINMLRLLLSYSLPYYIARLLHLQVDLWAFLQIIVLSSYIHMLNALTPLPGDIGWSEGMFLLLFMSMFSKNDVSSMMILWRFASFYLNMMIGALAFITMKKKDSLTSYDIEKKVFKSD